MLHRLIFNFALFSHVEATLAFDLANVRNETVDLCSLDVVKLFPSRNHLVLFRSMLITVLIAAAIRFFSCFYINNGFHRKTMIRGIKNIYETPSQEKHEAK